MKTQFSLLTALSIILAGCTQLSDYPAGESVNQRFNQSKDWNDNHDVHVVTVDADEYTILNLADSHVGGTDNLDSFLKTAKTTNATAVVMDGDLTAGTKEDYDVFESHLPFVDPIPVFLITGNHDLYNNSWKEYYKRFGSSTYLFNVKTPEATDLYICLDSGSGTIGEYQMEWLKNVLETRRRACRHCIVITHNNLFRARRTLSTNLLVEEIDLLIDTFTKYNVEMVITGHDHIKDVTVFGKTIYIQIPALKDGFSEAGYFTLLVKGDNIEYEFENI